MFFTTPVIVFSKRSTDSLSRPTLGPPPEQYRMVFEISRRCPKTEPWGPISYENRVIEFCFFDYRRRDIRARRRSLNVATARYLKRYERTHRETAD